METDMNIVKLKGMVNDNPATKFVAEGLLNGYTIARRHVTKSYTKNREDYMAMKILKKIYGVEPADVVYADLGANDYRRGNNTYLFYTQGARGVLVEANPLLCDKLLDKREGDRVRNVAIGTTSLESIDFYVLDLPTRSSMDKDSIDKSVKEDGLKVTDVVKVPCININSLFEEEGVSPDYMSIDIEGMDFAVLKTLDFDKYPIKIIVAEKDDETDEDGMTMDQFMATKGYKTYSDFGSNVMYVRKRKKQ